jgi:DNA modification methylase
MKINKIYNGDCLDLIKELPDGSIDCVITDPPYSNSFTHNGNASTTDDLNICKPFFRELLREIKRVLKENGLVYWFCDWRSYPFYKYIFDEVLPPKNMLVWDKLGRVNQYYKMSHEIIIFCVNGTECMIPKSSIIKEIGFTNGARQSNGEKVHPTQKSIEIISRLITDSTKESDLVLDCFSGSCTTAVSAIYNKRNFICFELQEKYCEIGQQRIEKAKEIYNYEEIEVNNTKLF